MSPVLGTELELATLPTNSNGTCRSSIATRYYDPTILLAFYTSVESRKHRRPELYAQCHQIDLFAPLFTTSFPVHSQPQGPVYFLRALNHSTSLIHLIFHSVLDISY